MPPPPEKIELAAQAAARCIKEGAVMVHCAHGRGRSTTVMVACLVRAGLHADWEEASSHPAHISHLLSGLHADWEEAFRAVKAARPVVALNEKMRAALRAWAVHYCAHKFAAWHRFAAPTEVTVKEETPNERKLAMLQAEVAELKHQTKKEAMESRETQWDNAIGRTARRREKYF